MNRYEQRKIKFLQDLEVAEGYREMAAEFQLAQSRASLVQQEDDQNDQTAFLGPLAPKSSNLKKSNEA